MARVEDYIGCKFGSFRIEERIGHGKEAEVFRCIHLDTGRHYALRLDIEDDAIWDGEPAIPPRNYSLERNNCQGTWLLSSQWYKYSASAECVPIYGVLNNRYLIPMACPVRVRDAWDINEVLKHSPADDLYLFEMWELLVLSMIVGAYESNTPDSDWVNRWSKLIGGSILQNAMSQYLDGGSLSNDEKRQVLQNVSRSSKTNAPEFAENTLLRLCGCISRGRMSLKEAKATLQCIYFRINISLHELDQIVAAYNALKFGVTIGAETSSKLLEFVLLEMTKAPLDKFNNKEYFEIREKQPDNSSFSLFLQEWAGSNQSVLQLELR
jgi:hypothetical protein